LLLQDYCILFSGVLIDDADTVPESREGTPSSSLTARLWDFGGLHNDVILHAGSRPSTSWKHITQEVIGLSIGMFVFGLICGILVIIGVNSWKRYRMYALSGMLSEEDSDVIDS